MFTESGQKQKSEIKDLIYGVDLIVTLMYLGGI